MVSLIKGYEMSIDRSHLDALQFGLSNERSRLDASKTDGERALRTVWVRQYEKQIADELAVLGLSYAPDMSDEELLRELGL